MMSELSDTAIHNYKQVQGVNFCSILVNIVRGSDQMTQRYQQSFVLYRHPLLLSHAR